MTIPNIYYSIYQDDQKSTLVLDGNHHCEAFQENGIQEIPAIEWKHQPIDYQENKIALLLESARSNISHGDRLTTRDKKQVAMDIILSNPECHVREMDLAEN